jgi:hypothetical protein
MSYERNVELVRKMVPYRAQFSPKRFNRLGNLYPADELLQLFKSDMGDITILGPNSSTCKDADKHKRGAQQQINESLQSISEPLAPRLGPRAD